MDWFYYWSNNSFNIVSMMKYNSQRTKCQVWSRVVGYLRPTDTWNEGKQSEFHDRKGFKLKGGLTNE